ncbi:gamma carbonic anhydrase family protein [Leucobacter massiliensis]|uniref:Gamma carbonic anhydrase family protein n=1 Tax=Leucobacter massiliensis TaxID=1686285 RepID=A0A2S9QR97_9MICO|nr:gamma carbonic anhydrase family protein [Leucobacter massiliensis]PRI12109.1 gamma carbonic anhydrase family protein [Leucobacter massiliensis]
MDEAVPSSVEANGAPRPHVISIAAYGEPRLDESAWLAPGSVVVGDVEIGAESSVWYNAVVRGDSNAVRIGRRSNLQDGVVVHTQRGNGGAAVIGDDVSIGHNAVVHGATIEDGCLIGMNATVLSGAVVGEGSLVAAGALVPQGVVIPPRSLVAGIPGRVVRELREEDREAVSQNAEVYLEYTRHHRAATRGRHDEV